MWDELESYKNQFLQKENPKMKAGELNEMVSNEFKRVQKSGNECCFPAEGQCEHSTYFQDHANLGYGFWALPQLIKEACSDIHSIQWKAINSLPELLMNPMEAQRAINEEDIVRIMNNIFIRKRKNHNIEKYREVESMMRTFDILSTYLNGAKAISSKNSLLIEFYIMIYNKEKYLEVASRVLRNLSEKPEVMLNLLANSEATKYLATIFHKDKCAPYYPEALWHHLSHFIEVAPTQAIERGYFDLLHYRIENQIPGYHRMNMKCYALMLPCDMGQVRFDASDGTKLLHRVLTNDAVLDTYEFVVLAIQNSTITKRSLWRCSEFLEIIKILMQLAEQDHWECETDTQQMGDFNSVQNNDNEAEDPVDVNGAAAETATKRILKEPNNERLQLYCFQSMRQMGQMPSIKRFIHAVCLPRLQKVKCLNELNECTRDEIVTWLTTDIYDTD